MIPVSLSSADDQGLQLQLKSGSQTDSPLEEAGFEPSVPRQGTAFSRGETLINMKRGTGGSNPLPSTGESAKCLVDQLADGFDDPAPCCLAVVIVMRGELVSAVQR